MDFIFCWILISNLTTNNYMPRNVEERLHICSNIISYTPKGEDPTLALSVAWRESRFTDSKGTWLCTRKGTLVKTNADTYRCVSHPDKKVSKLVRAEGPMQILKIYHCKGKGPKCNTAKEGVKHLYRMVNEHGKLKGLAIYAGGYVNPKSLRYARNAISRQEDIRAMLPDDYPERLPKSLMPWPWKVIK